MDKMTDARIRSWLKDHKPDMLAAYERYQAETLADFPLESGGSGPAPESLRTWLENRDPEILEQIPLW